MLTFFMQASSATQSKEYRKTSVYTEFTKLYSQIMDLLSNHYRLMKELQRIALHPAIPGIQ